MAKIVVSGAGFCGLAVAALLARDGHDVVVLERDSAPFPDTADAAWADWERRGVAQFRLAHILMDRGTEILRAELPDVTARLAAAGALTMNAIEHAHHIGATGAAELADKRFQRVASHVPDDATLQFGPGWHWRRNYSRPSQTGLDLLRPRHRRHGRTGGSGSTERCRDCGVCMGP